MPEPKMNIEEARTNMITQQIQTAGVLDHAVLDLFAHTPRELFVPALYKELAFADMPIPLGHGQEMLLPQDEALIIQALKLLPTETVLEIGTGSGFMTALMAKQAKFVESIDIFVDFIAKAQQKLDTLNIHNVTLINADAANGYGETNQYDAVFIGGSLPYLPENFRKHVKVNGRLLAIIGLPPTMEVILLQRTAQNEWKEDKLFETVVPPLLNAPQLPKFVF